MKSSGVKCRERQVKEASRRLTSILTRSAKLGVNLKALNSVSLVYGADKTTAPMLTLLIILILSLVSVQFLLNHLVSCHSNANKPPQEIHIQTIGWDRLTLEGQENSPLTREMENSEELPVWRPWRLRRER